MTRHTIQIRISTVQEERARYRDWIRMISIGMNSVIKFRLYIPCESELPTVEKIVQHNFSGKPHYLLNAEDVRYSPICYSNPFRQIEISSFPKELQEELNSMPISQQVAILKSPVLQKKYFPQYCNDN